MTMKFLHEENSRTALWESVVAANKSNKVPQYFAALVGKRPLGINFIGKYYEIKV